MALYRPEKFEEMYGNKELIQSIRQRLKEKSFPQFTIFYGEEGLGKTTLMRLIAMALTCSNSTDKPCGICPHCKDVIEKVIRQGINTNNVTTFRMSVEGGKEATKEVLSYLNTTLSDGNRVIILDEVQGMSKQAQDLLLHDTEHLKKGIYIMAATTDISSLNKTLLSRAVQYYIPRLKRKDIIQLIEDNIYSRKLIFDNVNLVCSLIADYAEEKPRTALNVLQGLGFNRRVHLSELKSAIQFADVSDFKEIVVNLENSMIKGISVILDMEVTYNTQKQLCRYIAEIIRFKNKMPVYIYPLEDVNLDISMETLTKFLYNVSNIVKISNMSLLASYIRSHINMNEIAHHNKEILDLEKQMSVDVGNLIQDFTEETRAIPTAEDLLRGSVVADD